MHPQFPQCSTCSGTGPLSIKLVLRGNPLILLEENKASVKLSVLIQLFGNHLDGSILNFLLLKAVSVDGAESRAVDGMGMFPCADPLPLYLQDLGLNVQVSIVGGRLVLQLALGR